MNILFGSQFYAPSIGGVQEVMRQLAEELVLKGHQVTIATTVSPDRNFDELNGVVIREFDISGNHATGLVGEVTKYQEYVVSQKFDLVMVMAAQQWTFDALWPVLDQLIHTRMVFIPCGFSGLYDPIYENYFQLMPGILSKIDHIIFHSTQYRDIDFAKTNGLENISVIPCGASEKEFNVVADPTFRARHNIDAVSFLFLTVGSFTGLKGHLELVKAFSVMELPENRNATLILNGNVLSVADGGARSVFEKFISLLRTRGVGHLVRQIISKFLHIRESPQKIAAEVNKSQSNKTVLITDLARGELTQAFIHADLFVFASNIEYSPLVLFESAAAGTPFLSVAVGNAPEIAAWTGAGVICPSTVDANGYTRVNEFELASQMQALMGQSERLEQLGKTGRDNWREGFTWQKIAERYEKIFLQLAG